MKKNILVILFMILNFACIYAQDIEGLKKINARSKVIYVKPEILDQLMIELRSYENSPVAGQDTLLLATYQSISKGYSDNNHYKQAYEVQKKYLTFKENFLFREMNSAINQTIVSVSEKQQVDDKEKNELQNKLQSLKDSNELLESKRLSFKRNVSFALIVLSSIFAIMLVSSGIRMLSLRSKHRQNNERMKNIHRLAVIGNLETGLRNSFQTAISSMETQLKEFQQVVKKQEQNFSPVKQANQIFSGIEKLYTELLSKFK